MISEILSKYANPDALFLDIGANLGIHGLYMARLGYRVWAIEPQEKNLIKVYNDEIDHFNYHPLISHMYKSD